MAGRGAHLRRFLASFVPVVVFALALVALDRLRGEFHLRDILAEYAAIESWRVGPRSCWPVRATWC